MSTISQKLFQLLSVLPFILAWTLVNTLISSVMAGVTFIQLISVAEWSKTTALITAIMVAIAIHIYLFLQPQIRSIIKEGTKRQ